MVMAGAALKKICYTADIDFYIHKFINFVAEN